MKPALMALTVKATGSGAIARLGLSLIIYMGSSATAWALQVLQASDHAELAAEISSSQLNRIALEGDRISRVIHSPGGFTVEHDAVRGDLYLYPALRAADGLRPAVGLPAPANAPAPAGARAPVTLYMGTEKGFTYRLTLSGVSRGSAQILIQNPSVAGPAASRHAASRLAAGGAAVDNRETELVFLIRAIARREPVPGYVIVPASESAARPERGALVELWKGPRFTARMLWMGSDDTVAAPELAYAASAPIVAAWVSAPGQVALPGEGSAPGEGLPPGTGPNGERMVVLVEYNGVAESVR